MGGGLTVETVVTTLNPDRTVNCAAMGVGWGDDVLLIRPYRSTRTFRKLAAGGVLVARVRRRGPRRHRFTRAYMGRGRGARRRARVPRPQPGPPRGARGL